MNYQENYLFKLMSKYRKTTVALLVVIGLFVFALLVGIVLFIFASASYSSQRANYGADYQESFEESYATSLFKTAGSEVARSVSVDGDSGFFVPEPASESPYDETLDRQIIKTGSLSLVVTNIDETRSIIERDVERLQGFISQASFQERGNTEYNNERGYVVRSGYLTIRVPVDSFIQAMEDIKSRALTVQNENISSNDVTEQYADLETQITNKQAVEEQYRSLLGRSTEIEDILKITQYLNQTRGEIERMQGQLNRLSNQVTLSTITVSLTAEEDLEVFGVVWSPWQEVTSGFRNLLQDIVDFVNTIIRFIFALPILVLYVVLYGGIIFGVIAVIYKIGTKLFKRVKKAKK